MVDRARRAAADGPRCIIAAAGARADPVSLPVVRPGARRSRARGPSGLALAALAGAAHADGLALTYQRCDGNRTIAGAGPGRGARAIDVSLPANAAWVVAAPVEDGARWLVALEDGRVARVRVDAAGGVGPARLGPTTPQGTAFPQARRRRRSLPAVISRSSRRASGQAG